MQGVLHNNEHYNALAVHVVASMLLPVQAEAWPKSQKRNLWYAEVPFLYEYIEVGQVLNQCLHEHKEFLTSAIE